MTPFQKYFRGIRCDQARRVVPPAADQGSDDLLLS